MLCLYLFVMWETQLHELVSTTTIAVCMQVLDFDVACLDESRLVVTSLTFSLTR